MKKIKFLYGIVLIMLVATGCSKDGIDKDTSFATTPKNTSSSNTISINDESPGEVTVRPVGVGASYFAIDYGHDGAVDTITAGYTASHIYPEGTFSGVVTALDFNKKPGSTSPFSFTMVYRAPENVDFAVNNDVKVAPAAKYAHSFLIYYGDVPNEVGTPVLAGAVAPSHVYPDGGPYLIHVVAISGNTSYGGVATTTSSDKQVWGLPIPFEDASIDYFFGTFGNVNFNKVANPFPGGLNTTANVGKYEKTPGAEVWSGTYTPLSIPINFALGKKIKVMVYNPDPLNIGKNLNVELESGDPDTGAPSNGVAVLKLPFTTSGSWEEIVFDFGTITPAIPSTARFGQMVLRFNDSANGTGEVFYVDNFVQTN